jgi:hypothetical protein
MALSTKPENSPEGLVFIETLPFSEMADHFLGDDGRQDLQGRLLENPKAGDVIPGSGGARKIRVAFEGRGKRGGGRVVYYYQDKLGRVHFLLLYAKNVQANLSQNETKALKALITGIDSEV